MEKKLQEANVDCLDLKLDYILCILPSTKVCRNFNAEERNYIKIVTFAI